MPDDAIRAMLEAKSKQMRESPRDTSLWGLVNGIHKGDALRDWVTLESRSLQPMVVTGGSQDPIIVHVLLTAVPATDREGPVPAPWGLVSWSWPEGRVIQKRDLTTLVGRPTGPVDRSLLASRKGCEAIEEALRTRSPVPIPGESLTGIYRAILQPEQPRDAAPQMGQVRDLLRECGQESLLGEWRRIAARTHAPRYTVAVAGEFSRGKSRLINTLLGRELLPEGDLPTTAMLARVAHGETEGLWHVKPDGTRTQLDSDEDTWAELIADDEGEDPEGVLHVVIQDEWLRRTGLQLVDTPGAGDIVGQRAALATEAIASSDATLVTVSATMPLSLTERAFVEQNVLMRAIPRVAVVITRLDQVAENDRERLIENVATRVAEFAPGADIWSSHGEPIVQPGTTVACAGPEAIRDAVEAWASDPDAAEQRNAQLASQLVDLLSDCERGLQVRIRAAQLKREERLDELAEARARVERRKMDWTDLELEMDQRALVVTRLIHDEVFKMETALVEAFTHEIQSSGDPAKWWDEQLPYRFRNELGKRIQGLQGGVQRRVEQDGIWLQKRVSEEFSAAFVLPKVETLIEEEEPEAPVKPDDLGSVTRTGTLAAVGVTAAAVGAALVAGPLLAPFAIPALVVSAPVAIGGGLAAKQLVKDKQQNQRDKIRPRVEEAVRQRLQTACDTSASRTSSMYRRMVEELRRQETAWLAAEREALDAVAERDDGTEELIQGWLASARRLRQQLTSAGRTER